MPNLTVTPNPAATSAVVSVLGSGFANAKTRLLLDGVGATTNVFRPRKDGTFAVGITVSATARVQSLVAQQSSGSAWVEAARTTISVQKVVVTPVPSSVVRLPSSADATMFRNACYDMTKDEVITPRGLQLDHVSPGSDGPQCVIAPDRTSRPLWVHPDVGIELTRFTGAPGAIYYTGQFSWGGKFITREGFEFGDYIVSQAGVEQLNSPQHLSLIRTKVGPITRYGGNNSAAVKTWGLYGSGAGVGSDVLIDGYTGVGSGRDSWSLIQFDSAKSTNAAYQRVTVRNIFASDLCFGFYEDFPMTDLLLENWLLTNVGYIGNGAAISFHQAQGIYHGIGLTNSGGIAVNSSRMVPG